MLFPCKKSFINISVLCLMNMSTVLDGKGTFHPSPEHAFTFLPAARLIFAYKARIINENPEKSIDFLTCVYASLILH